jgi:hypothetical protein
MVPPEKEGTVEEVRRRNLDAGRRGGKTDLWHYNRNIIKVWDLECDRSVGKADRH